MLRAGLRIDRYELIEPLGEGGQGVVWKVRDPLAPDAARALKILSLANATTSSAERMRREARTLAALDHPSLVRCHGMFEDLGHNVLGIVVDLVVGRPLDACLDDRRLRGVHGSVLLAHVVHVLAFLHERGVTHRDLKPENVIVASEFWAHPDVAAHVKLIDFGIARDERGGSPLTDQGTVIGTRPYLPPEQVDPSFWGESPGPVSRDVFGFGVLGWRVLSGAMPAGRDFPDMIQQATFYRDTRSRGGWPVGTVPSAWDAALRVCLVLDPGRRAASMTSVAAIVRGERSAAPKTLRSQIRSRGKSRDLDVREARLSDIASRRRPFPRPSLSPDRDRAVR